MTKRIHRVVAFAILVSVVFNGFLTACGNSGTSSKAEAQKTSIDPEVVYDVMPLETSCSTTSSQQETDIMLFIRLSRRRNRRICIICATLILKEKMPKTF